MEYHSAHNLLLWVDDLLDEVTVPEFIEENAMGAQEQLEWLAREVAVWRVRLEEYKAWKDELLEAKV